jgi:hypothetical protein
MSLASLAAARRAIGLLALAGATAGAQPVCKPDASTSEAKLLAFYASPLAFSAVPAVAGLGAGEIVVHGDITPVPSPPAEITSSSGACGFAKPENSGLAPVFPRPRVALGLGRGVTAELSWLPPVTVADATPHLGALALSWMTAGPVHGIGARVIVRAHATLGGVDGPITCPTSELQTSNPNGDCYGTVPSDDTYEPNTIGAEVIAVRAVGRAHWHLGAGVSQLQSRLQVNFTSQSGFVDRNVVEISLARVAVLGGVDWTLRDRLAVSAQLYAVPNDATAGRLGIAWRVR